MLGDVERASLFLGKSLTFLREKSGMSAKEMAERLGISENMLQALEKEGDIPYCLRLRDFMYLCDTLEVPPGSMFTGLMSSDFMYEALFGGRF